MKIVVYAICKNESKFVERWVKSMSEADEIIVCDTGSNDDTIEKLEKFNVKVKRINVSPWRFDVARNISLSYVPKDTDICVCTDLDEIFEQGWRSKLEKNWKNNTTRACYKYIWSHIENKNGVTFYGEKIHSRMGYKWIHPVHEVLSYEGKEHKITIDNLVLHHYPDENKSRSQYLDLLELSVKESPEDDRNMHYLGREYMYNQEYEKAIKILKKHLFLPSATWKDERCASMRYIAKCYNELDEYVKSIEWIEKAIKECPYTREPFVEACMIAYQKQDWQKAYYYILDAIKITTRLDTYITQPYCWDKTPYDLASICAYQLGLYKKSLEFLDKALEFEPNNKRLIENKKIIKELI